MVESVTDTDRDTYFARSIAKSLVAEHANGEALEISPDILKQAGADIEFQIHFRD
jgi:hypothetical protein